MTAWTDLDSESQDLSWSVLDHAVESLADGEPLIPFAVVLQGPEQRLHRFVADTLEEGIAHGRAFLAQLPEGEVAAFAFDGYLTRDGERTDAVYVEVHRRGQPSSGCLAQRYIPGAPPEMLGNASDCGDFAPLLGGAAPIRKKGLFGRR